jgi:CubicO group peptidase (beta-lactamase class C family)
MFEQATRYQREQLWSEMGNLVVGRALPCETRYSNVGYAALGDILAQRSQRTWESLVVDEVAKPLGLADTRQNLSPAQQARRPEPWDGARRSQFWEPGVFAPAGGLRSTATDLLVFSQALLKGRKGPLGAAPERLVTDLAPFGEQGTRIGYGVLMPPGPAPTWLHNGETRAFLAEWIVWPQTQEAVVMLASNRQAPIGDIRRALVAQTSTATAQEIVYTRGEFRGTFEEDGGRKLYARVKIAPGYKIPFSTLSYRVLDRKLLAGIQPGAAVDFRAERIDGENTIVALRAAAP